MVERKYWRSLINQALSRRPIVWLSGIRRSGKTVLSSGFSGAEYFDCELPRVRAMLSDPEMFLASKAGKLLVLDEIHKLDNPSEILKNAYYFDSGCISSHRETGFFWEEIPNKV